MGKKLSTLTAGFAAAAVLAGAIAPAASAYMFQDDKVNLSYNEAQGAVSADITHYKNTTRDTATLTITPAANYFCSGVSATYKEAKSMTDWTLVTKTISGVSCENTTFDLPGHDVNVTVEFTAYTITTEAAEWTQGSEEGLVITGNGAYVDFYAAYVDDNKLGASNFEVSEGSTNVTLKASYLATLAAGEHDFVMEWNDGADSASTTFTVLAAEPEEEEPTEEEPTEEEPAEEEVVAPNTGISSAATIYGIAAALILGGAFVAVKAKNEA